MNSKSTIKAKEDGENVFKVNSKDIFDACDITPILHSYTWCLIYFDHFSSILLLSTITRYEWFCYVDSSQLAILIEVYFQILLFLIQ